MARRIAILVFALGAVVLGAVILVQWETAEVDFGSRPVETGRSVVLIDTFDAQDNAMGRVVGFMVEPGHLVTARHCMEGVSRALVRVGSRNAAVQGVVADGGELDVILLKINLSQRDVPRLRWADADLSPGDPAWLIARDFDRDEPRVSSGRVTRIGADHFGPYVHVTAPGDFGDSGSPLVDRQGSVRAVVFAGSGRQGRSSTIALPVSAIRELHVGEAEPLAEWTAAAERPWGVRVRRDMGRAHWYRSHGDKLTALVHVGKALQYEPEHWRALALRAHLLSDLGQHDDALADVRRWLDVRPDDDGAWAMLGRIEHRRGRSAEAVAAYRHALSLRDDAQYWFGLGWVLDRLGRDDEALAAYQEAIDRDPERDDMWFWLGAHYHRREQLQEAVNAYQRAANIDGNNAIYRFWTARVLIDLRQFTAAQDWLRKCIEVDPTMHACHCLLGEVYMHAGRVQEAEEAFSAAIMIQSDCSTSLAGLAVVMHLKGDQHGASTWIDRLGIVAPQNAADLRRYVERRPGEIVEIDLPHCPG